MTCPYPDGCTNTVTTTTTTIAKAVNGPDAFAFTGSNTALIVLIALFLILCWVLIRHFTKPIDHKKGY